MGRSVTAAAVATILSSIVILLANALANVDGFHYPKYKFALISPRQPSSHHLSLNNDADTSSIFSLRGGADVMEEEDEEGELGIDNSDEEEEEEDEEEEEEEEATLASSTMKKVAETKAKTTKNIVQTALASTKLTSNKASSVSSIMKKLRIPYIVRACLNPSTFITMTKAYWGSLFNLDYLRKEPSQELRSALEEKAKASGGLPSGGRGKRKMKRGQAKTLSDLPKLNT